MIKQTKQQMGELECVIVRDDSVEQPAAAVILCHGFGAPATDLVSIGRELISADARLGKAVYVFPGAPLELDPMFDARAWWMVDMEKLQRLMESGQTREMHSESPARLPICRELINQVIEQVKRDYELTSGQIVLGGFSQGAMLSTDVALHASEPLGGLIVWSGALINEPVWKKLAEQQSPLNIVESHGTQDPILPIEAARDLKAMLTAAGHQVRYAEFVGPHTIPLEGLQLAAQMIVGIAAGK